MCSDKGCWDTRTCRTLVTQSVLQQGLLGHLGKGTIPAWFSAMQVRDGRHAKRLSRFLLLGLDVAWFVMGVTASASVGCLVEIDFIFATPFAFDMLVVCTMHLQ